MEIEEELNELDTSGEGENTSQQSIKDALAAIEENVEAAERQRNRDKFYKNTM